MVSTSGTISRSRRSGNERQDGERRRRRDPGRVGAEVDRHAQLGHLEAGRDPTVEPHAAGQVAGAGRLERQADDGQVAPVGLAHAGHGDA